MRRSRPPFAVPARLEPDLAHAMAYWRSLRRGGNQMPFWDDVKLSALEELSARIASIDVFDKPLRFRFGIVGRELRERHGESLEGRFADEITRAEPFNYFGSQCQATIESGAPTYYRHDTGVENRETHARLVLPLWGDGRVSMLLCAVQW